MFTTFEGDNTVLMQLVAKGLLTGHRQRFEDDRVFAVLKLLADRATRVVDRNPSSRGAPTATTCATTTTTCARCASVRRSCWPPCRGACASG
ncbi:hypothetical protein QEG98_35880 [Myxococcus sp. MxC21-1]|nr:hypothetical protein [Myxococcus sp. MxC21-1]WNZ61229.1 hypothetical protein QEG98_35880 [Myxococcus sp. MxC21-1]